jgi:hypothetical protein
MERTLVCPIPARDRLMAFEKIAQPHSVASVLWKLSYLIFRSTAQTFSPRQRRLNVAVGLWSLKK